MKIILTLLSKGTIIIFNKKYPSLELCLFNREVGIPWIWSHFTMLLELLVMHKTPVNTVLLSTFKIEHDFCYSNSHQMLSNLLWVLTYFNIGRATCVDVFMCISIDSF
jgi:hypothetical protein